MEKIIDNLDDEDFEDKDLFTYTFLFKDMKDEQKEYVISQFHDWYRFLHHYPKYKSASRGHFTY